jgi:hypothetical protein
VEIKSENQANITIVNALNNLETMLSQFRTTTDAKRLEIIPAIKVYADELLAATNYKAGA